MAPSAQVSVQGQQFHYKKKKERERANSDGTKTDARTNFKKNISKQDNLQAVIIPAIENKL